MDSPTPNASLTVSAATLAQPSKPTTANPKTAAALQEFESILIGEMTNLMFSTVPDDGSLGSGAAGDIYRSMLAQHIGSEVSKRGGLGLTPALMNEVIHQQGVRP